MIISKDFSPNPYIDPKFPPAPGHVVATYITDLGPVYICDDCMVKTPEEIDAVVENVAKIERTIYARRERERLAAEEAD